MLYINLSIHIYKRLCKCNQMPHIIGILSVKNWQRLAEKCLLELFKFPCRIVPLFPHVVEITQGISQIADGTVSLSAQVITQRPAKTQQTRFQASAPTVAYFR